MIGQLTTEQSPAATGGPVLWISADDLSACLRRSRRLTAASAWAPQLDGGERWLVEIDDPAGNRIGIVVPVGAAQSQTMIAVRDVEASSRWYQQLLGLRSDHGGPEYERLLAGGTSWCFSFIIAVSNTTTGSSLLRMSRSAMASCCGSARWPTSTTSSSAPPAQSTDRASTPPQPA